MLNADCVRDTINRLRVEGWHYERDLFAAVSPYLVGEVVETIQVLLLAGCIRAAGEDEKKRYKWTGR